MRPSEASDGELLAATRTEPHAFAVFYDRYEHAMLAYFMRRARDPEIAADLTAEVFAAALAAAERYQPQAPTAAAWLFTIAHNTLANSVRRGRVEADARRRVGIREAVTLTSEELERVESLTSSDGEVIELLRHLPPEQREAVRARVLEERSYPEIAAQLRTSELVVRKRVSRGLSRIKAQLEGSP